MRLLPGLRVGEVRMTGIVLDVRARGTQFVSLPIRSVLNSPQQTGMNFWSVNPYVGCEFGCSYCYARFAHPYVVERSGIPQGGWSPEDFEQRIRLCRLGDRIDTGGAAAPARLLQLDDGHAGKRAQDVARLRRHALCVREVTGIVIGQCDRLRKRPG